MKYFADILKQFSSQQRAIVLFLLLFFSSITFITTSYLKSDTYNCEKLVDANKRLYLTLGTVYEILIKQKEKNLVEMMSDSSYAAFGESEYTESNSSNLIKSTENQAAIDSVLKIIEPGLIETK